MAADEATAEIATDAPEFTPEPAQQPEVVESAPEQTDDDKEPGGASPEAVAARKHYRSAKEAKQAWENERRARIELEERLRSLEQKVTAPPAEEPKTFTPEQVQAAVDAGSISQAQATAYLVQVEARRILNEEKQKQEALRPIEKAQTEINEYVSHLPWTRDKGSPEYASYIRELSTLVSYGLPDNVVTQRLAVERVAGPLERLRQKARVDSNTRSARTSDAHFETPAGGAGAASPSATDLSRAPEIMRRMWDRTGTSEADRVDEFKAYLSRQKAKR